MDSMNDTMDQQGSNYLSEFDLAPAAANNTDVMNATLLFNVDAYLANHWGPKHLPLDVVIPITIVYVLIFVSGVVGNIAVCLVIIRNPTMHTATNCYLFSLAISDLTVLLFGLPNDLSVIIQQYPWALGETICKLRALIAEMTSYASVLTIVAFSLERYLAICHPLHSFTMAGIGRAARIVALIWAVALVCALPFATYTSVAHITYPAEAGSNLTGQSIPESAFCAMLDENQPAQWPLVEIATFVFFILPMGILCLIYVRIGVRIRRTSLGRSGSMHGTVHRSNESRQSTSRRTILRMLVAVVIGFFICWAPFHAQRLLYVYAKNSPNFREINEKMFFITGCFYYFSSTINPILYNLMSARYREAFRETLCGISSPGRYHSRNSHHRASDSIAHRSVLNHEMSIHNSTATIPVQGSVCHHYVNTSSQSQRSLRVETTSKMATLFAGKRGEHKRNGGTRAVLTTVVLPPCSSAPDNDSPAVKVENNVQHSNGNYRPKGRELKSSLLSSKGSNPEVSKIVRDSEEPLISAHSDSLCQELKVENVTNMCGVPTRQQSCDQ